jgi:PAS domain S-box-containing protein
MGNEKTTEKGKTGEIGDRDLHESLAIIPELFPECAAPGGAAGAPGDEEAAFELGSITRSLDALSRSCELLEERCRTLNWALEESNRKLRESLGEREKLASKLRGILRCLSAGVIAVDTGGRLIEFNPAAERITGYRRSEVIGSDYAALVGRGFSERLGPVHAMKSGRGAENEEKKITTASGERIPVSYSTSLTVDERGELLGAVEVFTDLRKSKALEEELLRTRTLAATGEMATDVARQIRNPLAGLAGFAELLERDLRDDPRRHALVSKIRQGVAAVEGAVVRLLENTRTVNCDFRPVDVVPFVENVLDLFEAALEEKRNVTLKRHLLVGSVICRINEEQIGQALRKVLLNAWEACGDGGCIEVSIALESNGPDDDAGDDRADGPSRFAVITVADNGAGMPPDVAANAFSPFYSTREKRIGLGLTAAKRIVTGHGGEIDLTSTEKGGTVVVLRLPEAE